MSTIKANTLLHSDGTTTTQPSIPALDQRMAKAWVNFDGSGTVSIRGSYNVSSLTDNGAGDYTVAFTTAMANTNYAVATGHNNGYTSANYTSFSGYLTRAVGSVQVASRRTTSLQDNSDLSAIVFGT